MILPAHDSGETLFRGEVITGPRSVSYAVGRLPMGNYHFHCDVHPTEMMGRFLVEGTGRLTAAGAMTMPGGIMMSAAPGSAARVKPTSKGSFRPSVALLVAIACCIGGLAYLVRFRRAGRRSIAAPETVRI